MKRVFIIALATIALAAGCSKSSPANNDGGSTPTTPSPTTTTSSQTFTVPLVAAAEVPAIANAESTAAGSAVVKLNLTKSGETIVSATADFNVTLTGFPGGSTITLAHIHQGAAGANGAILVNTGIASGSAPLSAGAGGFTKNGIAVTADVAQSILNDPAAFYFNVHSQMNPGGVIRGQMNGTTGVSGGAADPGPGYDDPYAVLSVR